MASRRPPSAVDSFCWLGPSARSRASSAARASRTASRLPRPRSVGGRHVPGLPKDSRANRAAGQRCARASASAARGRRSPPAAGRAFGAAALLASALQAASPLRRASRRGIRWQWRGRGRLAHARIQRRTAAAPPRLTKAQSPPSPALPPRRRSQHLHAARTAESNHNTAQRRMDFRASNAYTGSIQGYAFTTRQGGRLLRDPQQPNK